MIGIRRVDDGVGFAHGALQFRGIVERAWTNGEPGPSQRLGLGDVAHERHDSVPVAHQAERYGAAEIARRTDNKNSHLAPRSTEEELQS